MTGREGEEIFSFPKPSSFSFYVVLVKICESFWLTSLKKKVNNPCQFIL